MWEEMWERMWRRLRSTGVNGFKQQVGWDPL